MATATLPPPSASTAYPSSSFSIPETYSVASQSSRNIKSSSATSALAPASTQAAAPAPAAAPASTTSNLPPPSLHATFNYYLPAADGSPPAPSIVSKPETFYRPANARVMPVRDIRGAEDQYTLDTTGFQVVKHESAERDFLDEEQIKRVYYPEVETVLKTVTGASKVFIFDHTIRRPPSGGDDAAKAAATLRGPVQRVHVDQSYKAAPKRVTHHLPDEADRLLKGRFQIINLWRPIKTIRKDPLGVADAASVPDSDLVPVQLVYPDRVGETLTVLPNENHRWFYLKEQQPDEVLLIKCFDSKTDGRARRVPHSAFVDESTINEEARESIEVRSLVFHPDDTE